MLPVLLFVSNALFPFTRGQTDIAYGVQFRRYYFEDAVTTGKIPEALADAVRPIMEFEWSEGSKEAAQGLYDTWLQASAIDKPTPETVGHKPNISSG